MTRLPVVLLSLLALQTSACGACDTTNQKPIEYRQGVTTESVGGVWLYESTGVHDDWLHFPAGRTYDLVHGLPGTPQSWKADVSFKSRLDPEAGSGTTQDPNNAAPAAGNQVVVDARWGPRLVRIRNDTCAEVYVRFVAQYVENGDPADPADPDAAPMSLEPL